jgi:tyrosyl-tRNA synthetase
MHDLFSRGVTEFIDPSSALKEKIEKKQKGQYDEDIVIKFGVDPTRPDLHLGHAVILRKLRQFQDAGCKVVFLIGDATATIGDPTGRSKVRPEVAFAEIEKNMKTYLEQVGKILNVNNPALFSWTRNSNWLYIFSDFLFSENKTGDLRTQIDLYVDHYVKEGGVSPKKTLDVVGVKGLLWTLGHITHARLIERDMFQERLSSGGELYMHEMLYPVIQGIDSHILAKTYGSCDLEIGGSDQTFNMLMGRDVMRMNKQPEQAVMALEILAGLDGKEKMSKSLDNYIGVTDAPEDMYGKILSLPDSCIVQYFTLCTYTPTDEITEIAQDIASGTLHPKDAKMRLAREIVAIYHGDKAATEAETAFVSTFTKGQIPEDAPEYKLAEGMYIVDALVGSGMAASKTEARRLVDQGAVTHLETGMKLTAHDAIPDTGTYRIGKIRFVKFV